MIIETLIKQGSRILKANNIASHSIDSEVSMSKAIQKDRSYLILNQNQRVDKKSSDYFKNLINQRSNKKPIAYLLGKKDFWKYEFYISENVYMKNQCFSNNEI